MCPCLEGHRARSCSPPPQGRARVRTELRLAYLPYLGMARSFFVAIMVGVVVFVALLAMMVG